MIILDSLDKISDRKSPLVLTIGNFDGVHLGHRKLLKELKTNPANKALVVTFDPHPVEYFDVNKSFKRLFSAADQNDQMEALGIDYLLRMKFDQDIALMDYSDFLAQFTKKLSIKKIVIGHDLKIGKDRKGDRHAIQAWCQTAGIEFQVIEPLVVDGRVVSSTFIKSLLDENKFEDVPKFLGRPYCISGLVVHGDKRGRLIGFPTANLTCHRSLYVPHFGVYQTRTVWKNKTFDSITNVGKTPTFKSDDLVKVETHIFDFDEEIYDDKISIEFLKFVRSEKKFSGIEEIKKQIALDIASLGQRPRT
jgi:riboflavin kinase / FMN adenylyltransferase